MKVFKVLSLMNQLDFLSQQKEELTQQNISLSSKNNQLKTEIKSQENNLSNIKQEIITVEGTILADEIKAYSYPEKQSSSQLQEALDEINYKITEMIVEDQIITHTQSYTVNGSNRKGEDFQKFYGESLLLSFNNYFDKKAKAITVANFDRSCTLIDNYYKKMNKRASVIGDILSPNYVSLKLKSLKFLLDIKLKIAEERARMNEEKKRLREQERLLIEAEKEKLELAKKRRMYEQSLIKALSESERIDFENKLKEIDKREADIDYRVNNSRAGYLYVTSTSAMPNMTKIGVTRRLNPLVRIHELSSASVPFPFVCHGLVFSDDVFELETNIHEYFDKQRVNKENKHKEFFEITPNEAIEVLKNKFKCEVHFVENENDEIEESEEE